MGTTKLSCLSQFSQSGSAQSHPTTNLNNLRRHQALLHPTENTPSCLATNIIPQMAPKSLKNKVGLRTHKQRRDLISAGCRADDKPPKSQTRPWHHSPRRRRPLSALADRPGTLPPQRRHRFHLRPDPRQDPMLTFLSQPARFVLLRCSSRGRSALRSGSWTR